MARYSLVLVVFASALMGCAHTGARPAPAMAPFGQLHEGSVAAVGTLDFLNDHGHEFALLDHDLGLDRRASEALVAHRLGPDAREGTADDGFFFSLADVDGISWVGPATLQKLAGYAAAHGYMASEQRVVGSFEGVSFTFAQAEHTLDLVNTMSARGLDGQVQLDSRAVLSIVDARPIRSLGQLSELYWVGPAALSRLKNHAEARSIATR